MILTRADFKDKGRSEILSTIVQALYDIAEERRGFEESLIRQKLATTWSPGGDSDYRTLRAAAAMLSKLLLGTRGVVIKKQPVPQWMIEVIDSGYATWMTKDGAEDEDGPKA